jgi:hypothetical protein
VRTPCSTGRGESKLLLRSNLGPKARAFEKYLKSGSDREFARRVGCGRDGVKILAPDARHARQGFRCACGWKPDGVYRTGIGTPNRKHAGNSDRPPRRYRSVVKLIFYGAFPMVCPSFKMTRADQRDQKTGRGNEWLYTVATVAAPS